MCSFDAFGGRRGRLWPSGLWGLSWSEQAAHARDRWTLAGRLSLVGRLWAATVALCTVVILNGCGAKSAAEDDAFDADRPQPRDEHCNGLDDDLDGEVDEAFRDEVGRYVSDAHCGGCGVPCEVTLDHELAVACTLIESTPICAATECAASFAPSRTGRCVPAYETLCLDCASDDDCGDVLGATCAEIGNEQRCAIPCAYGCPSGYSCGPLELCEPSGGSCSCDAGQDFDLACAASDPDGLRCVGAAQCQSGALSACLLPDERCDESDNDCDGLIDEGYRDARGAYGLDIRHCGKCGVDCTADSVPEGDLICGGDPFAPSCVLSCPDALDGVQTGDRIDADRDVATGCECVVGALRDEPGPAGQVGQNLDVDCDGADGEVLSSIYVAPDGNDTWPGSPTRPLKSITAAIELASSTLGTDAPRPTIYVASGSYTESLSLANGVSIYGGYRRDFLALEPSGFRVEVRAPSDTTAPGGAALSAVEVGGATTVVRWMTLRGLDARGPSEAAFGAYLRDVGSSFALLDSEIYAGVGGAGAPGASGEAGGESMTAAQVGSAPRAAAEAPDHTCVDGVTNRVVGGSGGRNRCGASSVHGGDGGDARCPLFAAEQSAGRPGDTVGAARGGEGGAGGQDSRGPITGASCDAEVCCGLADFSVPSEFIGPQAGQDGADGRHGRPGASCDEPWGRFEGNQWRSAEADVGTEGQAGGGGGGGGAGGGAEMTYYDNLCEFPDGLGGGGGGGGAGGCGGAPGGPGRSGGPSVALLLRMDGGTGRMPQIERNVFVPGNGGRGGDGGAGGDGGLGGSGAFGGALDRSQQSTPTLAGPFPGARGGKGGDGGAGGGGGAGCGGGSVGIWVTGAVSGAGSLDLDNAFRLGEGGGAGRGGGGEAAASDGAAGGQVDVLVR